MLALILSTNTFIIVMLGGLLYDNMVNSNPRIPFVIQESQFVNESPGL